MPTDVVSQIHEWFSSHGKTLAFAESCTGGNLAVQITSQPGASSFFLGSLVVYSDKMKCDLLEVSDHTLRACGAVSSEVVQEMLSGLFSKTRADWGVAVSGIAGPSGGSATVPVGTIWAAVGEREKRADVVCLHLQGVRETIIAAATVDLLAALWRKVAGAQL